MAHLSRAEWEESDDPDGMILAQRLNRHTRKIRLLLIAHCRFVWDQLFDPSRQTVEVAERYVEGEVDPRELAAACQCAEEAFLSHFVHNRELNSKLEATLETAWDGSDRNHVEASGEQFNSVLHQTATAKLAILAAKPDYKTWEPHFPATLPSSDRQRATQLVRELFGNPFQPVTIDPKWRTDTVVQLAEVIYQSRDFSTMPILADALQDVGCENEEILSHCRNPKQAHVRGCWLVDQILDNE